MYRFSRCSELRDQNDGTYNVQCPLQTGYPEV
jgi:hypothetical protein